jgi:hypothetical protein
MSHLIEEYAKNLGCKISKPYLVDHFYPIPFDKYITFHTNDEKVQSKHYDYWSIVFSLIKNYLSDEGIKVVQIGGPKDPLFGQCDLDTRGATFKQMSYIINKSMFHFGIDSLPMHMASHHDKKMVCLFSNLFPSNANPIWNKTNKYKLLSPDFSKIKPSFSFSESPKRINEIKPESVAKEILSLLNIDNSLSSYKTLNIGRHFNNNVIEAIPNNPAPKGFSQKSLINLRCDYGLSDEGLRSWLNFRVNLMTSEKINLNFLRMYSSNIVAMTLFMEEENFDKKYLLGLDSLNIKYSLICRDKDKISSIRFDFFDWVVEEYKKYKKKDLDFSKEICDNTFYHSNKILISNSKEYSCKAAFDAGIERSEKDQKIIDNDVFWEEIEHINVYNYAKN